MMWWLLRARPQRSASSDEGTRPPSTAQRQPSSTGGTAAAQPPAALPPGRPRPAAAPGAAFSEDVRYVQNIRADPAYDWKQPINFYGRVVDYYNGEPIVGAKVGFVWNDLSATGTSETQTETAADGSFSLVGKSGKRLSVSVGKEGYYAVKGEVLRSFEYANPADGLFTADPNKPVVYRLRKKGASADFPINIPRDGTPVMLDVMQRRVGQTGQIRISENKPEHGAWRQATSWWFRMEIPDGGFAEENDEFPFEAPESGYQAVIQFDFQQGQTNWATSLKKDFYIKFGNPPRYGRFQMQTDISYGGAIITYAINPDGSRNLEPMEQQYQAPLPPWAPPGARAVIPDLK
jgi:hypothetical protein